MATAKTPCSTWWTRSPAVANDVVYVGSVDGNLYAFDVKTRKLLWTAPSGNIVASSTIANGVLYVGSKDGNHYAYDAKSGRQLWAIPIESSPAVAYGVVYVMSSVGQLYAFHLPGVSPY